MTVPGPRRREPYFLRPRHLAVASGTGRKALPVLPAISGRSGNFATTRFATIRSSGHLVLFETIRSGPGVRRRGRSQWSEGQQDQKDGKTTKDSKTTKNSKTKSTVTPSRSVD